MGQNYMELNSASFALVSAGVPVEMARGQPFQIGDVHYPWQTIELNPAPFLADLGIYPIEEASVPDGKIVVSSSLAIDGDRVVRVLTVDDAPAPTPDDVIAERERRLALGFDYDFGDERGVHRIGTTPEDMEKWIKEVSPIAQALVNVGQPGGLIGISTDTGPVTVTAGEWQQILLAAGEWRQPIYQASFALQAMDPIPADYADDERWP